MKKSSLLRYQLFVLLLLLTMAIVFAVIIGIRKNKPGILLEGVVLSLSQEENDKATYSGKIHNDLVRIVVTPDADCTDVLVHVNDTPVVTYNVLYPEGNVTYLGVNFPRIEIRRDDIILFQGGYDPNPLFFGTHLRDSDGKPYEVNAEDIDAPESCPEIIFHIMTIYSLARQYTNAVYGNWTTWFVMVLLSCVVALDLYNPYIISSLLPFFWIKSPDIEPSERYLKIRRSILIILLLVGYISGVQYIDYI